MFPRSSNRRKRRIVNSLALVALAAVVYFTTVALCLGSMGGSHAAQPQRHVIAWSILDTISPMNHHETMTALVLPAPEIRRDVLTAHDLWPWEQVGFDQDEQGNLSVHAVALSQSRAAGLAESVRDALAAGARHTAAAPSPAPAP